MAEGLYDDVYFYKITSLSKINEGFKILDQN